MLFALFAHYVCQRSSRYKKCSVQFSSAAEQVLYSEAEQSVVNTSGTLFGFKIKELTGKGIASTKLDTRSMSPENRTDDDEDFVAVLRTQTSGC